MAVTILEALQNAQHNFRSAPAVGLGILPMAQSQLDNAVGLLEKGYHIDTEVEPLLEEHGSLDSVPDITEF